MGVCTGHRFTGAGGLPGGQVAIAGPVWSEKNGRLALGSLVLESGLALMPGSTTLANLDPDNKTSNRVVVQEGVSFGGNLVRSWPSGAALTNGQSFRIFDSKFSSRNFSSISPAPGPGQGWKFHPATGLLQVVATPGLLSLTPGVPRLQVFQPGKGPLSIAWPGGNWPAPYEASK